MIMDDFLGSGWKYPVYVGEKNIISRREKSIEESIRIILGTAKGERVMRPDFGCDVNRLIFEINNRSTHTQIASYVKEALGKWEPRITLLSVKADADEEFQNRINVEIDYRINTSNTQRNLVYPFFLENSP